MNQVPPVIPSTTDAAAPPVFLDYQKEWVADRSPLKVKEKSRRTGLTWAEASDDVLIAASDKSAGGQNVYYIGYNQDMGIEYIEACAMWTKAFNYAASEVEEGIWGDGEEDRHIKTFTIRLPDSGHRIVALSSRPANLRGKQGVVVIDEAAFHEQLGELLKAALALLIWGGKVRVISTHNGESNPFNELIKDIRAGRRAGSVHRITFRDAVTQGLYRRVCMRLGKEWTEEGEEDWIESVYAFYGQAAEEELDVVPSQGSGTFLSRTLIERCMSRDIPVLRYSVNDEFKFLPETQRIGEAHAWCEDYLAPLLTKLDPNRRTVFGEDFGRSGDLSVILPLQEQQNASWKAPFGLELRNVPFEQQKQILFFVADRLPRFSHGAMDARGNGQYLAEVAAQRYGAARISEVMLSETWYRENMPRYKATFEDCTILLPLDADWIEDNRAFRMVKGVAKLPDGKTASSGGQRHGDAGVAGAMAWHSTYQEGGDGWTFMPQSAARPASHVVRGY